MQINDIKEVKNKILYLVLVIFLFDSCSDKKLNQHEYINWVNDESNGLISIKEISPIKFTLSYKPELYNLIKDKASKDVLLKSLNNTEKDQLLVFNLRIESINKNNEEVIKKGVSQEEYIHRIDYLSFQAQNDFKLIYGKDTLPCILYHFERSYTLTSHNNMLLGFKTKNINVKNDLTMYMEDKIFGNGDLYFTIKSENFKSIPKVEL